MARNTIVPFDREEMAIVHEALHDHLMAKLKEADELKAEADTPSIRFDRYKLNQYIEKLYALKQKFGGT